jgi:hypothetical protein
MAAKQTKQHESLSEWVRTHHAKHVAQSYGAANGNRAGTRT